MSDSKSTLSVIKRLGFITAAIASCFIILNFLCCFIYFPEEIKLTENITNKLNFGLPFSAKIELETVTVMSVNNNDVNTGITVDLGKPVTIEAGDTGTAVMTLNAFGFPMKKVTLDVVPEIEVIPCGMTIGVKINTDGVMVIGTRAFAGEDGQNCNPSDGKLKSGDLILDIDGYSLNNIQDLQERVGESSSELKLRVKRGNEELETVITPVMCPSENAKKLGVYVRDSTQGIGTVTYFNPSTNIFAALGHGILDVDTRKLMSIKDGKIMESEITSIRKGNKGTPGELVGKIQDDKVLGYVKTNSSFGIYGNVDLASVNKLSGTKMKIGLQNEIHEGPAVIQSNVQGNSVEVYDVYIESINRYSGDDSKGMVIRITDPKLLNLTNGIVQGMSGSPIIQDGKLIGAVTHVFVQDPTKGYGIFIENMLKHEKDIA